MNKKLQKLSEKLNPLAKGEIKEEKQGKEVEMKEVINPDIKKVDFTRLRVYRDLGKKELRVENASESIGNLIYQGTGSIDYLELARKIYNSKGEIELNKHEVFLLKNILDKIQLSWPYIDAIKRMLND